MLSRCQMIQNYGAVLQSKFGEPGVCVTKLNLEDGTTVVGIIDGFDHTTLTFPDGSTVVLEGVRNIQEIASATRTLIPIRVASVDVELRIKGTVYTRHLPGPPSNPERVASAYRDIVKELLSGNADQ